MLTKVRQIMLEDLLEKLKKLPHLSIVETVKGHDGEFGNHVAEGDKGLVLIHIEEENCCDIRHALNIADVWPMHCESF